MANRETIELFDAEVVASEAALSRSKNIEKSAKAELEQHRRWLERHAAAEARNKVKHERRLKQLRRSQRRWVKRQRLLRSLRQQASIAAAAARSAAIGLGNKSVAAAHYARDRLSTAVAWSRPRLQAAATASYQAGTAGYAWTKQMAHEQGAKLSEAGKIAAARGAAATREVSRKGAIGFERLSVKSRALALQLSEQGSAGLARSRIKAVELSHAGRAKASALSRSAGHAAAIGLEQAKQKSGGLAQSASELTAAAAVHARSFGNQALTTAESWSKTARTGAQQLRISLATTRTDSHPQSPPILSPVVPEAARVASQEPDEKTVIDFPDTPPPPQTPVQPERVAAPVDPQPRALAASALTEPGRKVKADKIEAKEKARRGSRGGKKKRKTKRSKS